MKLLIVTLCAIVGSAIAWPLAILHLQQSNYPPKAIAILVGGLVAVLVLASQRIHVAWTDLGKVWLVAQLLMVGVLIDHLPEQGLEKFGFFVVSFIIVFRMLLDLSADVRRLVEENPDPVTWYSSTFVTIAALALIGQVWWATFLMHDALLSWQTVWRIWGEIGQLVAIALVLIGLTYGRAKQFKS